MKQFHVLRRRFRPSAILFAVLMAVSGSGCVTTYDAWGRPVQSVDPGAAVVGAAAAGLIGYAIASDHGHHHHRGHGHGYYGHGHHRPYCP
jgi:hypothetical protein